MTNEWVGSADDGTCTAASRDGSITFALPVTSCLIAMMTTTSTYRLIYARNDYSHRFLFDTSRMRVLIKRSESESVTASRVERFLHYVQHHDALTVNQTAIECLEHAVSATVPVVNVAPKTPRLECCFTHRRSEGNMQIQFHHVASTRLVTKTFCLQPQYIEAMKALVLIANWREYLSHSKGRRCINGAATYLYTFVNKISLLDQ